MFDVNRAWEIVIAVLLGAIGGFARLLHEKRKLRWLVIVSELFISGFAGLMVMMLARLIGLSGDGVAFVCGMAGWIRPRILGALERPAKKSLGVESTQCPMMDESKRSRKSR